MLKLRQVTKTYSIGETINAIAKVDLKISAGEFVAILGPSGCGKSTLLNILGLLDSADSGSYLIDAQPVAKFSAKERARLRNQMFGFVFQSFNLLARTSVYDNVILPLKYRHGDHRDNRVTEVLSDVGLLERQNSRPNQLSGGQQQRVAIARALITDPQVILADEPTGNLDTKTGLEIMKLFTEINRKGTTVLMVTHNQELLKFATRVITMRDGAVVIDERNQAKGCQ